MNMYLFELKANRKFAITWLLVILGLVFFYSAFFPTFSKDMKDFITIINNLPANIRETLGIDPDTIGSILGYFAFVLTFIFICAGIEAMLLGLSILSKEVRERTADFLLSKPVSRIQIVTSKLLACLTIIFISNIIYFIGFYLILLMFANSAIAFNTYFLLTLVVLFMQLIFFTLGLLVSVIIPKIKAMLPIALGTIFGFYLLGTFTTAESLRNFIPFKYFDMSLILLKNRYELKYVIISLSIVIISIVLTYIIYKKKDVHAV